MNPVVRKALLLQEQQDAEIQRVIAALRGECDQRRSLSNPNDVEDWIHEYFHDEDPGSRAFDGWDSEELCAMRLARMDEPWYIMRERLRLETSVLLRMGEPI